MLIGVTKLLDVVAVLICGNVPWLTPLPGSSGRALSSSIRVGITQLGRSVCKWVPRLLCSSVRVVVLLWVSVGLLNVMQVISRRLTVVGRVIISVRCIDGVRSRRALTLLSLTWKL